MLTFRRRAPTSGGSFSRSSRRFLFGGILGNFLSHELIPGYNTLGTIRWWWWWWWCVLLRVLVVDDWEVLQTNSKNKLFIPKRTQRTTWQHFFFNTQKEDEDAASFFLIISSSHRRRQPHHHTIEIREGILTKSIIFPILRKQQTITSISINTISG